MSANDILQNFLSADNFPDWKWAFSLSDIVPDCVIQNNV